MQARASCVSAAPKLCLRRVQRDKYALQPHTLVHIHPATITPTFETRDGGFGRDGVMLVQAVGCVCCDQIAGRLNILLELQKKVNMTSVVFVIL
jgi:hypothetical protein